MSPSQKTLETLAKYAKHINRELRRKEPNREHIKTLRRKGTILRNRSANDNKRVRA